MSLLALHGILPEDAELCRCPFPLTHRVSSSLCPACFGLLHPPRNKALPLVIDDGGRAAAGYKGVCGDCVVRSVAIASQRPYKDVYREIAEINLITRKTKTRKTVGKKTARYGVYTDAPPFTRYMQSIGWAWVGMPSGRNSTPVFFRRGNLPGGRIIVSIQSHYCAVIDGVIHDTHDGSDNGNAIVLGYWVRESTTKPFRFRWYGDSPVCSPGGSDD